MWKKEKLKNHWSRNPELKEEISRKISLKKLGFKHSMETIEKIRKTSIGRKHPNQLKNLTHRFPKGHPVYSGTKSTQFKKGHKQWLGKRRPDLWKGERLDLKGKRLSPNTEFKKGEHRSINTEFNKENRKYMILPKRDTKIEVKIQNYLKELRIDFFTHQYMKEIEHGYQCDILIPSMNLVIECDGNYWHNYPTGNDIDHVRTKELLEKGFKVLRLWEFEINKISLEEFKERIKI